MTNDHIIYAMKHKDLCDYNPRFIMSSGFVFDYIIMVILKENEFPYPTTLMDCVFRKIDSNIIYMCRKSFQYFYWKKGNYECL